MTCLFDGEFYLENPGQFRYGNAALGIRLNLKFETSLPWFIPEPYVVNLKYHV